MSASTSTAEGGAPTEAGAEKGDGGGGPGAALGFLAGFAPWIVYWILSGSVAFETAIGVAFAIAVLSNLLSLKAGGIANLKVLEVGNTIAFVGLALIGAIGGDDFVARWIQPLGNGALLLIMLVSILIGRPFTLQYAKAATPPELWDSPGFLAVNRLITWIWVGAMALMTVLAAIPPILQGDATREDGGTTLSIVCYWVLPYAAMGLAVLFTTKYPDWYSAEFDDVTPLEGERAEPLPLTGDADRTRAGDLSLELTPSSTLLDEAAAVVVSGAPPGDSVVLTATNVDLGGNVWRSTATLVADDAGNADTRSTAATDGDYDGVDPTGLLWSMRFATPDATPDIYLPPLGATAVAVEAEVRGTRLTSTLVRRTSTPEVTHLDVHEDGVVGRLALPAGDGPHPAVLLVGGSEGGVDSELSNAALLASRGFAALTLGYFGAPGLPDQLVEIPLETFAAGRRWLGEHPAVDPDRVGVLCISRGTEGVLSAAARLPDLSFGGIVAISPSQVSWTAMGDDGTLAGVPSWTLGGEPVPHLDVDDAVMMEQAVKDALRHRGRNDPHHPHVLHLTRSYAAALDDEAAVQAAAIPVEAIDAPLLLLSGSDDQVWPSGPMAEAILARRRDGGADGGDGSADEHVHHEGGGHLLRLGLLPTDVTQTSGIALGGTRAGIAAAQADATRRVLAFFARTLG